VDFEFQNSFPRLPLSNGGISGAGGLWPRLDQMTYRPVDRNSHGILLPDRRKTRDGRLAVRHLGPLLIGLDLPTPPCGRLPSQQRSQTTLLLRRCRKSSMFCRNAVDIAQVVKFAAQTAIAGFPAPASYTARSTKRFNVSLVCVAESLVNIEPKICQYDWNIKFLMAHPERRFEGARRALARINATAVGDLIELVVSPTGQFILSATPINECEVFGFGRAKSTGLIEFRPRFFLYPASRS